MMQSMCEASNKEDLRRILHLEIHSVILELNQASAAISCCILRDIWGASYMHLCSD